MNDKPGDWALPPKRRNWSEGTFQIGFFVRYPDGATITIIVNEADETKAQAAIKLIVVDGVGKRVRSNETDTPS